MVSSRGGVGRKPKAGRAPGVNAITVTDLRGRIADNRDELIVSLLE